MYFEPAIVLVDFAGQNFQAAFPGDGEKRRVLGDIRFAVDISAVLRDTDGRASSRVRLALEFSDVGSLDPTGVIISGSDVAPMSLGANASDVVGVDDLRDDVGVCARFAVHICYGLDDNVLGVCV
jgi:hypothetical protein